MFWEKYNIDYVYMNKQKEIMKYSNPALVYKKAKIIFNEFELGLSTRINKKYMIKGKFTKDKWVHFGEMGYEDFTKHGDTFRQQLFKNRNKAWSSSSKNTPAFLSYHLLW